ncbi:MAG: 4Fe-4S binding protein, partial [Steroidobacteraceae bacterium]
MSSSTAIDVLRVKKLGSLVRARGTRLTAQIALLLLALVLVVQGFAGSELAPKNLATSLVWIHFRGVLVLVLLAAGNLFCMGCPLVLARDVARRLHAPRWNWPRVLRNKWLACGLFVAILFGYELFDWWSSPSATAILILSYFGAVVVVDTLFKHAAFCKFVCPIGQFNFIASTASPLEVRARSLEVCADCATKDCIRGRRAENSDEVVQRGCELALYVPLKSGNLDCTFCLDCVHACPHDNVALATRLPASELFDDPRRSGIGKLSLRSDFAALVVLFTFGALLNAFGMVSPVYAVQSWIASTLGLRSEWPV